MKVVIVSDTHGGHDALGVLEGDVLIHCGDFENLFEPDPDVLGKVDDWFAKQRFDLIFYTGGNHDRCLESRVAAGMEPFRNALFLHDSGVVLRGVRFYGAPWVPELAGHAFHGAPEALLAAWAKIPSDVDVLVTHTPPLGILDTSSSGLVLGCAHLAARLEGLSPRLHCFGHVHASRGQRVQGATRYVNATSVNKGLEVVHPPFVVELDV